MLYFEKFKHINNYEMYKNRLNELSTFRLNGEIKIKQFNIPDIGPSSDLKNFHYILDDFDDDSKLEIKYAIKSFEGEELETIEDCLILIDILMSRFPNKANLLGNIKMDILTDSTNHKEYYSDLIKCPEEQSLLFSGLFSFLVKRYEV